MIAGWTINRMRAYIQAMYEFTRLEEEPQPQPSGSRLGPPRKHTGVDLLDPPQFPLTPSRVREVLKRLVNRIRMNRD